MDSGEVVVAAFRDLSKAFPSLCHQVAMQSLNEIGVRGFR